MSGLQSCVDISYRNVHYMFKHIQQRKCEKVQISLGIFFFNYERTLQPKKVREDDESTLGFKKYLRLGEYVPGSSTTVCCV